MRKKPAGPGSGILMKAAMDYGRLGWSVVPVEPRGKAPMIGWEAFQHRRPQTTEIGDWFTRWPNANLAIVTGVVSDLVVLDLNPQAGGEASRTELEQEHDPLPESVESLTGGGGRHIYFRHPGGILQNQPAVAPGIDLHSDGGYVVAPPSMHASGESYRWVRSPDIFHAQPLPPWLSHPDHALGRSLDPIADWQRLSQTGVTQGQRRDAIASLAGYLLNNGVDPKVALQLMQCWNAIRCRPPLATETVIHAVEGAENPQGEYRDRDP